MTHVAIVTGSNKGIGFAIVKGLCEKYQGIVYLTSRDLNRGIEACNNLRELNLTPQFHQLDITDYNSILKFITYIKEKYGKIDILINNAGVLFHKDDPESKQYQTEQTLLVNFYSLVNFTEAMLPLIKDDGTILNISSSSGHLSRIPSISLRQRLSASDLTLQTLKDLIQEYIECVKTNTEGEMWGISPYVVSKNAVNAYTFMLNRELKPRRIKVNCVHPGYVMSDMTKGIGTVSSDEGAVIPIQLALNPDNGGLYLWHDGTRVSWDGPDPRGYIDNIY